MFIKPILCLIAVSSKVNDYDDDTLPQASPPDTESTTPPAFASSVLRLISPGIWIPFR